MQGQSQSVAVVACDVPAVGLATGVPLLRCQACHSVYRSTIATAHNAVC